MNHRIRLMTETPPLSLHYLRSQIVGINTQIDTVFGKRLVTYADYTASGRSLRFIEDYLLDKQALYANSHTEDDTTGRVTTELLHQAEARIKQAVNAGPGGRIIATGTGATGAIDRMQQIVGVRLASASRMILEQLSSGFLGAEKNAEYEAYCIDHQPVVFVSPYEHHSNELSWREGICTLVEVKLDIDGAIDLLHLEALLTDPVYKNRLRIGSFSAASNVTGMISPVSEIAALLHRNDALAFFDYAASAPYVNIDMNPPANAHIEGDISLDAIFISPHKFLGGPGASGVLVFNQRCYHGDLPPTMAAGGTVDYVGPDSHTFIQDIEAREKSGTPGILQTLKAALAFEIKATIGSQKIEACEHRMTKQAMQRWGTHPNIDILGNPDPERRVGIISFNILRNGQHPLHPRFVTTLLDDLFGIQSRAGCSCAGPYGHQLLGIDPLHSERYKHWITKGFHGIKPGWCRIGFHYVFDDAETSFLLDAVEFIADYGYRFLPLYSFDKHTGVWEHNQFKKPAIGFSVSEAIEATTTPHPEPDEMPDDERSHLYRSYLETALDIALNLGEPPADMPLFPDEAEN